MQTAVYSCAAFHLIIKEACMAKITVERPHALGREKARERAEQLVEKLSDKYGLAL